MNAESLSQFHMCVLNALGGIEHRINGVKKYLKERTGAEPVNVDWSPDIAKQERDLHCEIEVGAHAQKRRNALLGALDRIEKGTYGACRSCEQEIEPRRLEAEPCAEHCMDCISVEAPRQRIVPHGISRAWAGDSINEESEEYAIHPKTLALTAAFKGWKSDTDSKKPPRDEAALARAEKSLSELKDRVAFQRESCGAGGIR